MTDGNPVGAARVQISPANSATIVAGSIELTTQDIDFLTCKWCGFTLTWDANALKPDVISAVSPTYRYQATS